MAVREGLLALLDEGPRYGYQLKTAFETVTGGAWPLNVGQVYTTLDRLARDGLVAVDERDGQKSYELTAAGREELGAWWQATPVDDPPPRDELMLKVLMAVGTLADDGPRHALDVITRQRTAVFQLLQRRRRERADATGSLADELVTDALIVRAEADLRWLDVCEQKLLAPRRPTNPPERTDR